MYGLDLRDMAGLEAFVAHMEQRYERLDVLVNNATQTIRRPAAYYSHLMPAERSGGAAEFAAGEFFNSSVLLVSSVKSGSFRRW